MGFDWTAAAIGVLLALVSSLATAVAFLVRRELDHQRERLTILEERLRGVERKQDILAPVAAQVKRKMEEQAATMVL